MSALPGTAQGIQGKRKTIQIRTYHSTALVAVNAVGYVHIISDFASFWLRSKAGHGYGGVSGVAAPGTRVREAANKYF